jgi:hypothetical protein
LAAILYKGDLAILEQMSRIKIFTPKNDTYVWKETKWLQNGKYPSFVKSGIFVGDKWFIGGYHALEMNMTTQEYEVALLKVFDKEGKLLKSFFKKKGKGPNRHMDMKYHVATDEKNSVFFARENLLKVSVISVDKVALSKEIHLEQPSFYKSMPEDFYMMRKHYKNIYKELELDMEKWATEYSAITRIGVYKNYLVVQLRTASSDLKKFALLFYDREKNFKLEKTVFLDDFMLGLKDGKFYFFANGNPAQDEDTDDNIINIYSLMKK